jgi:beta-glucosidase
MNTIERKVEDLLAKMTLPEKIGQMVQVSGSGSISDDLKQRVREGRIGSMLNVAVPEASMEIQRIAVQESRLGIPLIMARDVIHGFRTIFPIPLGIAAAWDPQLVEDCARAAAKEASRAGFHWTFAPMLDIARDPRWGRIAESFGEDPCLASLLAAAAVRGFQGSDLSRADSVAACAKHFAGYGAAEGGRDYDTVNLPENLLRDVYLPPFKAAVDAGAASIMTAFNEINGVPATGNMRILRDILREEWGFEGIVISDWNAVEEMVRHGFCEDMRDAARKAIAAGVDIEMQSSAYSGHLEELVQSGAVPLAHVDAAVRRILTLKFSLGLFDMRERHAARLPGPPNREVLQLAKTAALKSIVLLQNRNNVLPLSRSIRSIAVMGPMADDPYEILGTWNRDGRTEDTVTPLAAIRDFLGDSATVHYGAGLDYSRSRDTRHFARALGMARRSEAVLFFAGEESILSGEGHSRACLNLPGVQEALIAEIARSGKPVVLVILAGRPLAVAEIARKVDAILYAWHPGTMCGPALADLIFGIESPSGKLPVTFPKTEGQIPVYYAHKNTGRPPDAMPLIMIDDIPRRAYQSSLGDAARYLDIGYSPLYAFGYGLSYTTFEYANLRIASDRVRIGEKISVSADVTNAGAVEAEEVVQLYVRDVTASLTRPVRELKGFERIRLKPQETRTVVYGLTTGVLGFHDSEMRYVVEPGKFSLWIGGSSQASLAAEFRVVE